MEHSLLESVKGPMECERSHVFSGMDGAAIRFVPDKDVLEFTLYWYSVVVARQYLVLLQLR